jgi:hypothetical protein
VPLDHAVRALSGRLTTHASLPDFEIDTAHITTQAQRKLRDGIRCRVITEREGRIHETGARKTALGFVAQLDHRPMTSTASRMALVQRGIATSFTTSPAFGRWISTGRAGRGCCPPGEHGPETLTLWMALAREAGAA